MQHQVLFHMARIPPDFPFESKACQATSLTFQRELKKQSEHISFMLSKNVFNGPSFTQHS
jgi:hypothetical protein